jgi:microcompartment protein CcmK/EutM
MKAAFVIVAVCLPAVASAGPHDPAGDDLKAKFQAQVLLDEGTAAYGHGDYATALDKFGAAYRIYPSPKLWFNIGQANRDLGRPVEAVAAFDRFLRDATDAPAETLTEARRSAAELKKKLGRIDVTCATDGAEITVDGKQIGSTPLGEMVWTTPGRHQVAVQHAGFSPAIEDVVVTAGSAAAVSFQLRPIDLQAPNPGAGGALVGGDAAAAERKPIYKRPWSWVATGVVIGAGVAAAVLISSSSSTNHGSTGVPETTLGAQRAF